MTRKLTMLVAALGTAGIAGVAVVSAIPNAATNVVTLAANQSTAKSTAGNRQAACQDFVKHFAANLGVSPDKLNDSFHKSVDQTIDDAVKAGTLTSTQAAKLKARLDKRQACAGARFGDRGHRAGLLNVAATALHLSPSQLKSDLQSGMTLHQVADKQGVSEAQFKASVESQLNAKADKRISNRIDALWDRSFVKHGSSSDGSGGPTPTASPSPAV